MNVLKSKKVVAVLVAGMLGVGMVNVHATGIPVVDAAANTSRQAQHAENIAQMIKSMEQDANQWQEHLKQIKRGELGKILNINLGKGVRDEEYYKQLLDKKKKDCAHISTLESRKLCVAMVVIDERKLDKLFDSMKKIDIAEQGLQEAVSKQRSAHGAGEKNTAEAEVNAKVSHLSNIIESYNQEISLLDEQREQMRKMRESITRLQMQNETASKLIPGKKTLVIMALEGETKRIKNKARTARNRNNGDSNKAFFQ